MTFQEACHLSNGKNIRRKEWPKEAHIFWEFSEFWLSSFLYRGRYFPCSVDIFAEDWEIVE